MAAARRYFAWQARLIKPALGSRIIEVGCGTGNFTAHLWDCPAVLATDASAEMVRRTQARIAGIETISAERVDLMSPDFSALRDWNSDSCVALNVLEHIKDDGTAVKQMASVLAPGGRLALFVPASPKLYGTLDSSLGHVRRYTKKRLTMLADGAGLAIESVRRVNWVGFFAWWVNAKLLRFNELPAGQIRAFDDWVMPWLESMEHALEPPIGQSLLLIARKDGPRFSGDPPGAPLS
jgi:SAM-dependent methyltransferase